MPRPRRALSLLEVVVALAVVGVAATALAASLAADRRLRDLAAAHAGAARSAHTRLEVLAVRPCAVDTSGTSTERWGEGRWSASVSSGQWRLADSLALRRSSFVFRIDARVACPE